jgi:hypothetical protein
MMICPRIIDVQKRAERNLEVWRSWLDRKPRSGLHPRHICSTPLHNRITSKIPCLLYVNFNQDILFDQLHRGSSKTSSIHVCCAADLFERFPCSLLHHACAWLACRDHRCHRTSAPKVLTL